MLLKIDFTYSVRVWWESDPVRVPWTLIVFKLYFDKYGKIQKIVKNKMLLKFDFTYSVRVWWISDRKWNKIP